MFTVSMPAGVPRATGESGHFYFGETGHFYLGTTEGVDGIHVIGREKGAFFLLASKRHPDGTSFGAEFCLDSTGDEEVRRRGVLASYWT
jgi:hypothetical protein